ncbi:pantoate--beta-alanine ligase [Ruegeria pomeroyi]|uniref:Pantothenate synthetase n=2 Tax=Ruegeria pomeroyi TaxID=89184 RepID=PANC_RUEPO|nr:pantoate--beta-alanine ligase [Ruegeria pomeroyi]Q5LWR2.1 RecName: Full=Pantothenate synthetase; Short=PS; AltName: Full=Pantoate--beta-alanine ligase; AltName: Full=Pantoate-activating enzyme [Ruegeria pomeroyi DSS-3]HCE71928.1 pantoate--beta-alanine ligase [Ruegeria sp.]AAV93434.1 pantoate--beta-alanine ligase [Ruegeria pomeroyi DSS-3]NVK99063.1 pantoate--beta-alanine ligase [Ruegeria pomeroyi]NVL03932.1 pantoate--beta-alanine ligase [Ruegeria pomeroyi]QWV10728.1 pantoate--beta-alanine l
MSAPILRKLADLRAATAGWKRAGESIGVVPTMGALHDGHLSLVAAAKAGCDRVVVTIFVNPKQFNNPEDLAKYPRTELADASKLAPYGVDAIYVPDPDQIYPEGFATTVSVSGLTDVMEGACRPGHFDGVATVVAKLFLQTGADQAYFGEKDYQQMMLVTRMAQDLDIPITVVGCPTVREASGLAMSSRNMRLSAEGLERAGRLHPVMRQVAERLAAGASFGDLAPGAREALGAAGFVDIEYFDLRAADSLRALDRPTEPARLLVAAWLDGVRLIDNIAVSQLND